MRVRHQVPLRQRLLLACYPRPWRARYAEEFLAVLAARGMRVSDLPDLLRGALDARLHPLEVTRPSAPAVQRLTLAAQPAGAVATQSYGAVGSAPVGEMSRRAFMRRMLGLGAGLLSLEFLGGTVAFLWPQIRSGLGASFELGTVADIVAAQPSFANGWPYAYAPARIFLVNVPAAEALALGNATTVAQPASSDLLALWRKCPHLGCLIPEACDSVKRYRCRCHGSTYNILGEKLDKGPAERGMDRFAVSIRSDDGVVVVDTSKITRGAPAQGEDHLGFHDAAAYKATCSEL